LKKFIRTFAFGLLLVAGFVASAEAQRSVSVYAGVGTAWDSSTNQTVDTFGDGQEFTTPSLHGVFVRMGADVMLQPKFGVGGNVSFLGPKGSYAGLNYRPIFYDFNGIYHPLGSSGTIVPELQAGLGSVYVSFCDSQQFCEAFTSANQHFQAHIGGGVNIYVKGGIFVRPQADVHWVNNFHEFGSAWVPEVAVSFGYTFGKKQ
jgi:hypothetical protein